MSIITPIINLINWFDKKTIPLINWLDKRKEDAAPIYRDPYKKLRKNLSIVNIKCGECGNDKAFFKGGGYKCTKCKHRFSE